MFFYSIESYCCYYYYFVRKLSLTPCVYADGLPVHRRPLRIWVKRGLVFSRSGVGSEILPL